MVEQLVEAWRVNHRVTLKVIDALPEAAFAATLSSRGGRDVARQLAHVHEVRTEWLRKPDAPERVGRFAKGESPSRERLRQACEGSADAVERLIRRACAEGGKIGGFKRGG